MMMMSKMMLIKMMRMEMMMVVIMIRVMTERRCAMSGPGAASQC